ncbi:CBL-interacting serine/threonine-protein kinase 9 isoform X2 [Vigna angularis]|uniref:CBL-interacting serine/threonine-protein kinase 9 isoform X2 n=1 Tax=Phaseolus angularis TaxID=3914 RepID=UPI0022B4A8DE|nr:CBL-interacting serine/threonine-protein kinase 9 isoform X2 [Vigna angularis]
MSFKVAKGGVVVGKYELGKTIGEGSFAKVKFARDVNNGNNVAIKILDRKHVLRHNMMEQLQREISTMRLINHPNVTKIFEVMASKTKIYIVMELLDGGELFDKIAAKGKLEEDEARNYFQQLINAVDYCHSRGVYHRDLKPENLLLDSNSVLKVSDFGLSTYTQKEDELLRTACGTPNYVAPEVIHNKGYVGSTSDIWSCGVILFVLMAGFMPFDAPTHMALFKKIIKAEFTCPSWFPPQAKTLLKRILDPNPQTRIKIPELLKDEWFKKGYKPTSFTEEEDLSMDDKNLVTERKVKPVYMNAFELISRSQSFNLDSLFEMQTDEVKQETCFTSQCPAIEIMHKIEEAAKPLGFNVQIQNYKMKLQGDQNGRKGHLSMATEVFEVAPSVHMVELRKTGGDTLEFHKACESSYSLLQIQNSRPNFSKSGIQIQLIIWVSYRS